MSNNYSLLKGKFTQITNKHTVLSSSLTLVVSSHADLVLYAEVLRYRPLKRLPLAKHNGSEWGFICAALTIENSKAMSRSTNSLPFTLGNPHTLLLTVFLGAISLEERSFNENVQREVCGLSWEIGTSFCGNCIFSMLWAPQPNFHTPSLYSNGCRNFRDKHHQTSAHETETVCMTKHHLECVENNFSFLI